MFRSLLPLLVVGLVWCGLSFLFWGAAVMLSVSESVATALNLVVKSAIILAMSSLTAVYMVRQESFFLENPRLRIIFMAGAILGNLILFLYVRQGGSAGAFTAILSTTCLFLFALLAGAWIAVPVRRIAELVPLCVVMSLADSYSVFMGPSQEISASLVSFYQEGARGVPPIADFLLIKFPLMGFSRPMPVFGVSDWIIVSFLVRSAAKFDLRDNLAGKSLSALEVAGGLPLYLPPAVLGLVVALFAAGIGNLFVPALPVVAAAFLAFILVKYPQARAVTPEHWRAMILFALCFAVIGFVQFHAG